MCNLGVYSEYDYNQQSDDIRKKFYDCYQNQWFCKEAESDEEEEDVDLPEINVKKDEQEKVTAALAKAEASDAEKMLKELGGARPGVGAEKNIAFVDQWHKTLLNTGAYIERTVVIPGESFGEVEKKVMVYDVQNKDKLPDDVTIQTKTINDAWKNLPLFVKQEIDRENKNYRKNLQDVTAASINLIINNFSDKQKESIVAVMKEFPVLLTYVRNLSVLALSGIAYYKEESRSADQDLNYFMGKIYELAVDIEAEQKTGKTPEDLTEIRDQYESVFNYLTNLLKTPANLFADIKIGAVQGKVIGAALPALPKTSAPLPLPLPKTAPLPLPLSKTAPLPLPLPKTAPPKTTQPLPLPLPLPIFAQKGPNLPLPLPLPKPVPVPVPLRPFPVLQPIPARPKSQAKVQKEFIDLTND